MCIFQKSALYVRFESGLCMLLAGPNPHKPECTEAIKSKKKKVIQR